MQGFDYLRPETISGLKKDLSNPGAKVLAGGTDIVPKMRQGVFSALVLVDASRVISLDFIEDQGKEVVIGALTTHQKLADSALIQNVNPALTEAAESVGCIQTRCRGTLGGNIANASPAADTIPALLIYDADLLLQSLEGERILPLENFLKGSGETALKPGEFIHSVSFSPLSGSWGSVFLKIGKRSGMAISVVNGSAAVVLDDSGMISDARIALGAVAPTVIRCRETESFILGKEPTPDLFQNASEICRKEIMPMTDVRSTKEYRIHSAAVIARRALEQAVDQARERKN